MGATRYDEVAYPTSVFPQTNPERLAVLAHIHGLTAPDIRTARVLEIGGGNGLNLMPYAAAYPDARLEIFDLAEAAVARGQALASAAGLSNVTLEVRNILEARAHYAAGSFDYVIAHGVYAWVPEAVRRETIALIAHVLSDTGIGFVSFNAKPGGHVRSLLRDMLLHVLDGVEGSAERIAALRAFLAEFSAPREDDAPLMTGVRDQARSMLDRPDGLLFHDELGPEYAPQLLSDVVAEAGRCGLTFLTDAGRNHHLDGFLADADKAVDMPTGADADAAVVRAAQRNDFQALRFFRQPVFVRSGNAPSRALDADRIAELYVSTRLKRRPDGEFVSGEDTIAIPDAVLADAIERLAALAPARVPIAEVATTPEQRRVVLQLFAEWYVDLTQHPAPFATEPGTRPRTSPLVRAQLAAGERLVCSLDHRVLAVDQAEMRALLLAADGTRTLDEIAALPDCAFPRETIAGALAAAAGRALLLE